MTSTTSYAVLILLNNLNESEQIGSFKKVTGLKSRMLNNEIAYVIRSRRQTAGTKQQKAAYRNVLDLALEDPEYGSEASMSELIDQIKPFSLRRT